MTQLAKYSDPVGRQAGACEKTGWSNALAIWESSRGDSQNNHNAALSTSVISTCSKAAKWLRGLRLLKQAEVHRLRRNLLTFNALLNVKGKGKEWQQVVSWLRLAQAGSVQPDRITYSSEINAVGSDSQWLQAVFFVQELCEKSISGDVISCNSAMSACNSAVQWAASISIFQDLILQRVSGEKRQYPSNIFVMNSALSALGLVDLWEDTFLMLKHMESAQGLSLQPSLVTRSIAMSACTFVGRWDVSLHQMSLLSQHNEVTCSTGISACALGSLWAEALSLCGMAIYNSWPVRVRSLNDAIAACGRHEQWQWALHMLSKMRQLRVEGDVITYTSAITACERSRLWKRALLLSSLTTQSLQVPKVAFSLHLFVILADTRAKLFQWASNLDPRPTSLHTTQSLQSLAWKACGKKLRFSSSSSRHFNALDLDSLHFMFLRFQDLR